jgi:peptidoglycan hydrolase-like protein with peptidoglycan-binding domain
MKRSSEIMAQVVVNMKTIDLRKADQQPVEGEDVKTLQALLNLFLTAGDVGEDGTPIPPLEVDGIAGAATRQATLAFQTAAHLAKDAIVGPLSWRKLVEQDF